MQLQTTARTTLSNDNEREKPRNVLLHPDRVNKFLYVFYGRLLTSEFIEMEVQQLNI